jgi:hypothetical protein
METEFLDLNDLFELRNKLIKGDETAIDNVIEELGRLQSIIKDYELGMRLINDKFNANHFKKPKK